MENKLVGDNQCLSSALTTRKRHATSPPSFQAKKHKSNSNDKKKSFNDSKSIIIDEMVTRTKNESNEAPRTFGLWQGRVFRALRMKPSGIIVDCMERAMEALVAINRTQPKNRNVYRSMVNDLLNVVMKLPNETIGDTSFGVDEDKRYVLEKDTAISIQATKALLDNGKIVDILNYCKESIEKIITACDFHAGCFPTYANGAANLSRQHDKSLLQVNALLKSIKQDEEQCVAEIKNEVENIAFLKERLLWTQQLASLCTQVISFREAFIEESLKSFNEQRANAEKESTRIFVQNLEHLCYFLLKYDELQSENRRIALDNSSNLQDEIEVHKEFFQESASIYQQHMSDRLNQYNEIIEESHKDLKVIGYLVNDHWKSALPLLPTELQVETEKKIKKAVDNVDSTLKRILCHWTEDHEAQDRRCAIV